MNNSASTPATNHRRQAVFWLMIGGMINYFDRATLAIAAPEMSRDLELSATHIGMMGTAFAWCYALAQLPSGWIIDRFNSRLVFAGSMLLWSLATLATGFASGLIVLILLRALLGVTEAPCWPTATKVISVWYPKQERGIATGIFTSSAKWGAAIAPPVLVTIMVYFGWRGLFIVSGLAGIIYAIIFYAFFRNPDKARRLPADELEFIKAGGGGVERTGGNKASGIPWSTLFTYRAVWGMILGYFCNIWIWNMFIVFLPSYLSKTYHVSLAQMGIYASLPWIGGAIGAVLSGFAVRSIAERFNLTSLKATKTMIGLSTTLTVITVCCLPLTTTLHSTVVTMIVALFFISVTNSLAWALATEIAPQSMVGSVSSIQNFGGYFGGAFSPLVAGLIVDATGSYALAFLSGGLVVVGAAVAYLWIVDKPIEARELKEDLGNLAVPRT
ncbi:MFS transporter [Pseudomonas sp. NPDC089422]|uniref:MFS transporter n=1 Tax=Pseudomonas sp. NPDC089422 TaxID=3364466 RepID=UPI00383027A1